MFRHILLVGTLFLFVVSPAPADCPGDPGYTLDVPALPGLGEPLDICMMAPANDTVFLIVSNTEGPTDTPFGQLCVGPPILLVSFRMPNSGILCLSTSLPCEDALLGFTAHLQFISVGSGLAGRSNGASMTIVDNGRCP